MSADKKSHRDIAELLVDRVWNAKRTKGQSYPCKKDWIKAINGACEMNGHAIKTRCILNHPHPSISEALYCNGLVMRMHAREIHSFALYKSFQLSKTKSWKPDFTILDNSGRVISIHECKGRNLSDDNFRLKLALFFERYPKIPVYVNWQRVMPSESGKRIIGLAKKKKKSEEAFKKKWAKRLQLQGRV